MLINSHLINTNIHLEQRKALGDYWAKHIKRVFKLADEPRLIITNYFCCLEFKSQDDVRKVMFCKWSEDNKRPALELLDQAVKKS